MEKRCPWNGPFKLLHALLYTVAALANFCVLELVRVLVPMLILNAYSGQNARAIFWRINLISSGGLASSMTLTNITICSRQLWHSSYMLGSDAIKAEGRKTCGGSHDCMATYKEHYGRLCQLILHHST